VEALALRMSVPRDEMLKRVSSLNFPGVPGRRRSSHPTARMMTATVVNSTAGAAAD
jgi:hypothetical protein